MGDLVTLTAVPTEMEAELICSILRDEGVQCYARPTNVAVGMGDGYPTAGPREVVVRAEDVARAREVLEQQPRL